jgi:hypothetical protein
MWDFTVESTMVKAMRFWMSFAIVGTLMASGELRPGRLAVAQSPESTSSHPEQSAIRKLLNFQTANYAIRVFEQGRFQYLDVYEKSKRDLLLLQVPVITQINGTETIYSYQSYNRTYTIRVATTGTSFEIRADGAIVVKEAELPLQPPPR